MTWFDSIYDLQYYNPQPGVPCYCDLVVLPSDMYLQGLLPSGNSNYMLKLYVMSADGLTQYEDATAYFDYFFGITNGQHFFTARLKSFSPAMCSHECYIIRAHVTQYSGATGYVIFDKYTERYCQNECCDTARGVVFDQVGFSSGFVTTGDLTDPANFSTTGTGIPTVPVSLPTGMCGEPLIRIISKFDCIDKFTGTFFAQPDVVISGTGFEYRKITTLRGRLVRKPREIKRELSYNCKLQRVESTAQYLLEGFELLPAWKMNEIEAQLHANYIYVDDFKNIRRYQYAGGTPMRQISNCFELFKLETYLEDCTQRQIFGCDTDCEHTASSSISFAIPAGYNGGAFYDESKELIAHDYEMLLEYLRTQDGVTEVVDENISGLECTLYKAVTVTGQRYLPTSIFHDGTDSSQRIFGERVNSVDELCNNASLYCARPQMDGFTTEEHICATPVIGALTTETIAPLAVTVVGYADWDETSTSTNASLYNNEVTLNIKVVNDQITEDPQDTEATVVVDQMMIGVVGGIGRPSSLVSIHAEDFASMPTDTVLTIDEYGIIRYSGDVTAQSATNVTIELSNLKYNL